MLHQTYVKDIFIEVQTNQLTEQFLPYQKLIKEQERKLVVTSRLKKEMGNNLVLPVSLSTNYCMVNEKTNSLYQQLLTEHTKLDKVDMDLEEEFTEIQSANKVAYELWYPALYLLKKIFLPLLKIIKFNVWDPGKGEVIYYMMEEMMLEKLSIEVFSTLKWDPGGDYVTNMNNQSQFKTIFRKGLYLRTILEKVSIQTIAEKVSIQVLL